MYVFEVKYNDKNSSLKDSFEVRFSVLNGAPETKLVDYWTGKAILAAFAQGRNEARKKIKDALEMERIS